MCNSRQIVEADDKEVVYEITSNLPDAGLGDHVAPLDAPILANAPADVPVLMDMTAAIVADVNPKEEGQRYPTRACRSAAGNQPCDTFSPKMMFLLLGEVQAHRSVLDATKYAGLPVNNCTSTTQKHQLLFVSIR
jgi:hypothetical protein